MQICLSRNIQLRWFFYILGFAKDNQKIFQEIFQLEIQLLMKHYFSFTEIQNMSYFDFKLYVEAIHNEELAQARAKEEAKAQSMKNMNNFGGF